MNELPLRGVGLVASNGGFRAQRKRAVLKVMSENHAKRVKISVEAYSRPVVKEMNETGGEVYEKELTTTEKFFKRVEQLTFDFGEENTVKKVEAEVASVNTTKSQVITTALNPGC